MSTTTSELKRLDICLAGEWNEWDSLTQVGAAKVSIEFDYEPGQREILAADPNDSQPGFAPQVTVYRVTLTEDLLLTGDISETKIKAGTKLWDSLAMPTRIERISPADVERLEDEILQGARESAYA